MFVYIVHVQNVHLFDTSHVLQTRNMIHMCGFSITLIVICLLNPRSCFYFINIFLCRLQPNLASLTSLNFEFAFNTLTVATAIHISAIYFTIFVKMEFSDLRFPASTLSYFLIIFRADIWFSQTVLFVPYLLE